MCMTKQLSLLTICIILSHNLIVISLDMFCFFCADDKKVGLIYMQSLLTQNQSDRVTKYFSINPINSLKGLLQEPDPISIMLIISGISYIHPTNTIMWYHKCHHYSRLFKYKINFWLKTITKHYIYNILHIFNVLYLKLEVMPMFANIAPCRQLFLRETT